jgi:hypothetical protein
LHAILFSLPEGCAPEVLANWVVHSDLLEAKGYAKRRVYEPENHMAAAWAAAGVDNQELEPVSEDVIDFFLDREQLAQIHSAAQEPGNKTDESQQALSPPDDSQPQQSESAPPTWTQNVSEGTVPQSMYEDCVSTGGSKFINLYANVSEPTQWTLDMFSARDAVERACVLGETNEKPVVIADTQDNPGAGGDSNTTGLLRALLEKAAGKRLPGKVALGLLFDPETATMAHEAGLGASITTAIGTAVPTFTGQLSDPPVQGTFKVKALSDGKVTLKGPMMTGSRIALGPCALLEIEGVLVAVASGKKQLLDRELFRMLGVHPETMKVLVVKSSNHFRADFTPIASHILVAKAAGPMAADPADLPWTKLAKTTRTRP